MLCCYMTCAAGRCHAILHTECSELPTTAQRAVQERKAGVKERMREQKVLQEGQREKRAEAAAALEEKLKKVPRALHRLHKRGRDV
jgi:hypothetical protein